MVVTLGQHYNVREKLTVIFILCVCVFFPFIRDIKFVGRTSRGHTGGRSHRISHPPSFCGACLNFSREKDSTSPFPRWNFVLLLLLLLFLTFSVLVANPKKLLYTVANPARGLLNREKRTKEKVWQHTPPPPHPPHCSFGENK